MNTGDITGMYEQLAEREREIERLREAQRSLRNELCLKCGRYHEAHNGTCDGCKWKGESQ